MRRTNLLMFLGTSLLLLSNSPVHAQSLQFQLGAFFPRANGQFWTDTRERFTLARSDFNDAIASAAYHHPLGNYLDLGVDVSVYQAEVAAGERGYTDEEGYPVIHDTRLTQVPAVVDLRFYPLGREHIRRATHEYRSSKLSFYLGAGVGVGFWQYEEVGDFVDQERVRIYYDRFVDSGAGLTGHILGGLDVPVADAWSLLLEGRYRWAEATLGGDFAGLGKLDLTGASASVGVAYHF